MDEIDGGRRFRVVHNDEGQFSLWAADRDLPAGWQAAGTEGTEAECLAAVERCWTDQRPRSLRGHLTGRH